MRTLPILCALLLLGTAENLRAQERIIISGTLRDAATSRPVESANVLLQDTARRAVYNYAITGDDGVYRLEYRGDADSLAVAITGFNIHEEVRFVAARTQRVDFAVRENPTEIREVIVRAPAVTRRRDTLTYTVAKYADATDRSIGDVLRKMPGIEVAKSGEVKYNGKAINKFYIEGLDMKSPRSRSTITTSLSRRSRTSSPRTKRP